jgi:hypothetical protein
MKYWEIIADHLGKAEWKARTDIHRLLSKNVSITDYCFCDEPATP